MKVIRQSRDGHGRRRIAPRHPQGSGECRQLTGLGVGKADSEHLSPTGRAISVTPSQHHHSHADLHSAVEIDHILIGQPDAAGGNRLADIFRLVGAVDAIQRILPASVKV